MICFPALVRNRLLAGILLFCCQLGAVAEASEALYYPKPGDYPIQVGKEKILPNYKSLQGLRGVHVDLSVVINSSNNLNIALPSDLQQQVQEKIENAGLKFLTEDDVKAEPGQPILNLWPSYKGGNKLKSSGGNKTAENTDGNQCRAHDYAACRSTLWAGFSQSAIVLRNPDDHFRLSTWGAGDESEICLHRGEWMATAVLTKIDEFIADYKKAEAEKKPLIVNNVEQLPVSCSQSWTTVADVFDTDDTTIKSDARKLFDRFVNNALSCTGYSYIVETHADQRANAEYNRILTTARAYSIKEYLMSRGLPFSRLKLRPMGESVPLSLGDSEEDHAINRRVTIIPATANMLSDVDIDI